MMQRRSLLAGMSSWCLLASASGQAFNVDFGANAASVPASSYGAGASQAGFWNVGTDDFLLHDIHGNPTSAHFGFTGSGSTVISIPGASGGDKALMESSFIVSVANFNVLGFEGLAAREYDLYLYCWAGSALGRQTVNFLVDTGSGRFSQTSVSYGATWPGQQVDGETYAKIRVEVLEGQNFIAVVTRHDGDFAYISGAQLVPVPAPGAALPLIGLGALLTARRRLAS